MMRRDRWDGLAAWPFPGEETLQEQGYYAGLVNARECPATLGMFGALAWHAGNQIGLAVHCAVVEAVYLENCKAEDREAA